MTIQQQIEQAIIKDFKVEFIDLVNESHMHSGPALESHFKLTLVSPDFNDLNKVKRQQAVYKSLSELMPQFHALGLHTYTPVEWLENNQSTPDSPKCGGGH